MKYWMYVEDGQTVPAIRFGYSAAAEPPTNYSTAAAAQVFEDAKEQNWFDPSNYRRWREAAKEYIINTLGGGSEEAGFAALPTADNKKFFAKQNLGTGLQRLEAIPDNQERDKGCFDYISINEGISFGEAVNAIKNQGGVWLKALMFSRTDHIPVAAYGGINFPTVSFIMLNIVAAVPTEITGNLVELHRTQGIDGFTPPLGVGDFPNETTGTRFAPANGGGLVTNAALLAAVVDSITNAGVGVAGYTGSAGEQLEQFAQELINIVKVGKPTYLN